MSSLSAAGGLLVTVITAALAFEFLLPATAARAWIALIRQIAGLRTHRIELADATLEYLDGGSGEALLLIHGFGGDKDNFSLVAPFLTRHFRVIAPDLPGFGNASRDPAARYRIADQVRRLHELIARAEKKGFSDPLDLATYAAYGVGVHPTFDQHVRVDNPLSRAKAEGLSFITAISTLNDAALKDIASDLNDPHTAALKGLYCS